MAPHLYRSIRTGLFSLSVLLAAVAALAQSPATGIVEGRVSNPATGENIELVRITVEGTKLETFTDADGQYRLAGVPAGTVRVRAFRTGSVAADVSSLGRRHPGDEAQFRVR
jgi:hypothetical protein